MVDNANAHFTGRIGYRFVKRRMIRIAGPPGYHQAKPQADETALRLVPTLHDCDSVGNRTLGELGTVGTVGRHRESSEYCAHS